MAVLSWFELFFFGSLAFVGSHIINILSKPLVVVATDAVAVEAAAAVIIVNMSL